MLEYGVQVKIGNQWQPVTEFGRAVVFGDPDDAAYLCKSLNKDFGEYPHRVAVREVSPWCEMKRKVVC